MAAERFDLVAVGSSFAASFFVNRYLEHAPENARVLVLERGERLPHSERLARWQQYRDRLGASARTFENRTPEKPWVFTLGFGGSSNCWWACTPRMLPSDFRLRSRYGVGEDWPLGYDDLEEYYSQAEALMSVSGASDRAPYPRSRPYPLPAHRLSDPDRLFQSAFPDAFFAQPTARPSRAVPGGRPRCCANGVCGLCPIDSKFTIQNGMGRLYDDPRVTVRTGSRVTHVETTAGVARSVGYVRDGREHTADAAFVALGANALFNAQILLASGFNEDPVGRGLVEQTSVVVDVDLDGLDNFQGSTSITGLGYMLYDGAHRAERAGAMMESWNVPRLRAEPGKHRHYLRLKFVFEDLRQARNRVTAAGPETVKPTTEFHGVSSYAERGMEALAGELPRILAPLPVERFTIRPGHLPTESHLMGTTVMGTDPATSVVDADLLHHRVRNLAVLGAGTFPTAAPANPTLTLSALSLRAADRLMA